MVKEIQWSDDPEDKTITYFTAPELPPPHCGGKVEDVHDKGSNVMFRHCCMCHRGWECTRDEWINGTCPHCGASGPNGKGVIASTKPSAFKIKNQKYMSKDFHEFTSKKELYISNNIPEFKSKKRTIFS